MNGKGPNGSLQHVAITGANHHKAYPSALKSPHSDPTAQALHLNRLPARAPGRPTAKST